MHLLALCFVGLVIRGVWGHKVEVLTTPCQTLTVYQNGASDAGTVETSQPNSPIVIVESPAPVAPAATTESNQETAIPKEPVTPCDTTQPSLPTVLDKPVTESVHYDSPTELEDETVTVVEPVTPCDTTQASTPSVTYKPITEPATEPITYVPPIEPEDKTATSVGTVTPCDTTQTSSSSIIYEPATEPVTYVSPIVTIKTYSTSQHVRIMTTEPLVTYTESTEQEPAHYPEPRTDTILPTIQTSKASVPSNPYVPGTYPPVHVPISEPAQPPISTEPVQAPDQPVQETEHVQPPVQTEQVVPPVITKHTASVLPSEPGHPSPSSRLEAPKETMDIPNRPIQSSAAETPKQLDEPTGATAPTSAGPVKTGELPTREPDPASVSNGPTAITERPKPIPSGFTTRTSIEVVPTDEVYELNLEDAILGPYAKLIDICGEKIIVLEPPPYHEANFTLKVNGTSGFSPGGFANLITSVKIGKVHHNDRRQMVIFQRDDDDDIAGYLEASANDDDIGKRDDRETKDAIEEWLADGRITEPDPTLAISYIAGSDPKSAQIQGMTYIKRGNIGTNVYRRKAIPAGGDTTIRPEDDGKECNTNIHGTPTAAPTPVEVHPNEAGNGAVMNTAAVFGISFFAAILV
ncbi:unnamed protein product [Fusarium graminearum]|uniref:Uncharacterized protein n=1 Tax=Gibberella zeae TaxID=5518 RepID=A0A2H3FQS6_GIBZA|nr:hypothetical protein HG531_005667 [Fusarium graminearum]PCD20810.1 hypothetical protein FGRA07_04962 [Fusarium graminearum]CAG1986933.1 unnamed protein product [Fusarium graminearum]CAG2013863.1 unnamed protein product [Fusarium graminearum]VTO89500.1 unnamed protein product [Fusarium graminearum]